PARRGGGQPLGLAGVSRRLARNKSSGSDTPGILGRIAMRLAYRLDSGLMASPSHAGGMEGSAMSLSAWEQQSLDTIKNRLTGSDPELAALLITFTQLTAGEDMPVRATRRARS